MKNNNDDILMISDQISISLEKNLTELKNAAESLGRLIEKLDLNKDSIAVFAQVDVMTVETQNILKAMQRHKDLNSLNNFPDNAMKIIREDIEFDLQRSQEILAVLKHLKDNTEHILTYVATSSPYYDINHNKLH